MEKIIDWFNDNILMKIIALLFVGSSIFAIVKGVFSYPVLIAILSGMLLVYGDL